MNRSDKAEGYDRFTSALRTELEEARLGDAVPDFSRLDQAAESSGRTHRLPIAWATAAAIILVVGSLSYPVISTVRTRRLISADNQEFLDTMFERSLFDAGNTPASPLGESSWFDTDQITADLEI